MKEKCIKTTIGIKTDGVLGRYSSKCQHHGKDGKECDIRLNGGYDQFEHPIIGQLFPIYYQVQNLKCMTHRNQKTKNGKRQGRGQKVKIFEPEFELSEHDDWFDDTKELLKIAEGGIIKYGDYLYTWSAFRFIWNKFVNYRKVKEVRDDLINEWKRHWITKFKDEEWKMLFSVFDCNGHDQVLQLMFDAVLPSLQVLADLCKDFGFKIAVPIQTRLAKAIARLGARFWVWDGTWSFGKGIILFTGGKTQYVLICVKDQFGVYAAWELVPAEKSKFIVPIVAGLVYKSLMFGPYRDDTDWFLFSCDNAFKHKKVPKKIFKFIQRELNGGNHLLTNEAGTHTYNLRKLAKSAKV